MKTKKLKPRSSVARALHSKIFQQKIIKNKKKEKNLRLARKKVDTDYE